MLLSHLARDACNADFANHGWSTCEVRTAQKSGRVAAHDCHIKTTKVNLSSYTISNVLAAWERRFFVGAAWKRGPVIDFFVAIVFLVIKVH